LNSAYQAQDIVNANSACAWNDDMYGVDVSQSGAQAYFDSLIDLYASWGVDFIKADDMVTPYHQGEAEALSRSIRAANRDIAPSLSPGVNLGTVHYEHLKQHCELFRISGDFWGRWVDLKNQFEVCKTWSVYTGPGCWADADILPLGHIGIRAERGIDRQSLLTNDEQVALMTLWVMSTSPLMFGGNLPSSHDVTLELLTNDEVLRVHQASSGNCELFRQGTKVVWAADSTVSDDKYLALFNVGEDPSALIEIDLAAFANGASYEVRDLWKRVRLGIVEGKFRRTVAPHSAKLYCISRLS
jgi:alpha-galactosidase